MKRGKRTMKEVTVILEAEAEAGRVVATAEAGKDKILAAAHDEALRIIARGKEQIDVRINEQMQRKAAELEKAKKEILHKAEGEAVKLSQAAQRRMARAQKILYVGVVGQE